MRPTPGQLSTAQPLRVLMVCTGNICRSPMAESILSSVVAASAIAGRVSVDSAGLYGYHVGDAADRRASTVLAEGGYRTEHRARRIQPEWIAERDLVLAMDAGHRRELLTLAASTGLPGDNIGMLRDFDPRGPGDVDDPYYDTIAAFRDVRATIERCMPALLTTLERLVPGTR